MPSVLRFFAGGATHKFLKVSCKGLPDYWPGESVASESSESHRYSSDFT